MDDDSFLGISSEQNQPSQKSQDAPHLAETPLEHARRDFMWKGAAFVFAVLALALIIFLILLVIPNSLRPEAVQFEVPKGASFRAVAGDLKNAGLVRSKIFFETAARFLNLSKKIQSGAYSFSTDMSTLEILGALTSQRGANEVTITIPEGWTATDIAQYLENRTLVKAADFLRAAEKDYSTEFSFLKDLPKKSAGFPRLEGYLFPDTYRVFKDAPPEDIVRMMLKNFDAKLLQHMRNEILLQRKSIHDIVIMASIIEREIRTPEDKALVSGILWKRLRLGIALQADASIVYLKTGGRSRTAVDKVYADDLKIDSPYNTYKYRGLPSGPISNPGIESIEAALYPKSSQYLYYLSAPDGTTIFSRTLEEHNANKARYLK